MVRVEEGCINPLAVPYSNSPPEDNQLTQWLLLQDEENGVKELEVFCEIVKLRFVSKPRTSPGPRLGTHVVQHDQLLRPSGGTADALVQPVRPERRDYLSQKEYQQCSANERQN